MNTFKKGFYRLEEEFDITRCPRLQKKLTMYYELNHWQLLMAARRIYSERIINWFNIEHLDDVRQIITDPDFEVEMISKNITCRWEFIELFYNALNFIPDVTMPISEFDAIKMEKALNWGLKIDNLWIDTAPEHVYGAVDVLKSRGYGIPDNVIEQLCSDIFDPDFFDSIYDRFTRYENSRLDMLKLSIYWGYNPFVDGNLFREYDCFTDSDDDLATNNEYELKCIEMKSYYQDMIAERNSMDRIFNIWDTVEERQVIRYVMMYQSIIPGMHLLPIELMQMIFGYMRYYSLPELIKE